MSLIGPRPERPAFCAEFEKRIHGWHYRTMATPGLSGLAQVTGGYDLLLKEKVVLDLCGCAPRCFGLRPRWRLRLPRPCPRARPRGFWVVPQEMGVDFAMGPGLLCGFRRGLFAAGSADLGKRRRVAAFRAGSACETAQKSRAGLAGR